MKIIELVNLSKSFRQPVLINLDYIFLAGKTYLIIGENGSGKSTLIKLILGLLQPTSGHIQVQKSEISYVPDNLTFPSFLTISEFLYNLGLIYGISASDLPNIIKEYLGKWSLPGSYKLSELSKGMAQKVLIIQAFMKDAPIYIFDEPLNGLDKEMQARLFIEIQNLKARHKTILLISHQIEELSKLCDYKLNIIAGRINEELN